MIKLLKLPIGIQNFEKLIKNNYVYVDKTAAIYNLIDQGSYYFLSRPRRFGKSLLISTLDAIFQGKQELFRDCSIANADYKWVRHPVIWLDMSLLASHSPDILEAEIKMQLSSIAKQYGIEIDTHLSVGFAFAQLITNLAVDNKVVILVDEYDKPILDQINNPEIASKNRDILKDFYGIIKSQDQHLRFVFFTGISKFTKVSIFSELNNLNDISFSAKYASLLGYTQTELESYFGEYAEKLAKNNKGSKQTISDKIS